jgi:hypothetical protein
MTRSEKELFRAHAGRVGLVHARVHRNLIHEDGKFGRQSTSPFLRRRPSGWVNHDDLDKLERLPNRLDGDRPAVAQFVDLHYEVQHSSQAADCSRRP